MLTSEPESRLECVALGMRRLRPAFVVYETRALAVFARAILAE
jgi:hypothetical protein